MDALEAYNAEAYNAEAYNAEAGEEAMDELDLWLLEQFNNDRNNPKPNIFNVARINTSGSNANRLTVQPNDAITMPNAASNVQQANINSVHDAVNSQQLGVNSTSNAVNVQEANGLSSSDASTTTYIPRVTKMPVRTRASTYKTQRHSIVPENRVAPNFYYWGLRNAKLFPKPNLPPKALTSVGRKYQYKDGDKIVSHCFDNGAAICDPTALGHPNLLLQRGTEVPWNLVSNNSWGPVTFNEFADKRRCARPFNALTSAFANQDTSNGSTAPFDNAGEGSSNESAPASSFTSTSSNDAGEGPRHRIVPCDDNAFTNPFTFESAVEDTVPGNFNGTINPRLLSRMPLDNAVEETVPANFNWTIDPTPLGPMTLDNAVEETVSGNFNWTIDLTLLGPMTLDNAFEPTVPVNFTRTMDPTLLGPMTLPNAVEETAAVDSNASVAPEWLDDIARWLF